ncbi:MAG TPA: hypothetical protein VME17_06370 [Bryobacteraceae bacterium]|nr:hypothetical protein [Bryobacteraceae bacterium]
MARQALVVLIVVAAFGILVPLYKGFGFLDPRIIAAYACLALLFVAPASAELASAEGSSAAPAAVFGKIALIVAWGWGVTLLILASAVVTLNLMARRGGVLIPPPGFLAAVLTFSLVASIAIAALGALLARRFSASGVKNILRTGFLVILLLLAFGSRVLPERVQLEILDRFSTRRALTSLAWELSVVFAALAALLMVPLLKARGKVS